MTSRSIATGIAAAILLWAAPARADEHFASLIESKSDSVVSVKYVLNLQITMGGQTQNREYSGEGAGVLLSEDGLIVMPGMAMNPHPRGRMGRNFDVKATPTSLRVVFPGDPKEYEAVLGATDSRLDLAFLKVKDLEGKKIRPVDLATAADVKLGDTLYGVSRLGQSFDYAPWCDTVTIVGQVTKPRKMWALRGSFREEGNPLYDASGALVGFVIQQEGVGGGDSEPFLVPLPVVKSTIERAGKEADRVLEESKNAKEGAAGEKPGEGDEGKGAKAGEGDKDEGGDSAPEGKGPSAPPPPPDDSGSR